MVSTLSAAPSIENPYLEPNSPVQSLYRAFEYTVERLPVGHLAIRSRERQITFVELNALANGLALQIQATIPPGSFIPTLLDDNTDILIAILAINKAGCASVTISGRQPLSMIKPIIEQVDMGALIAAPAYMDKAHELSKGKPIISIEMAQVNRTAQNLSIEVHPDHPFSMTFTSGSTGIPKGHLRLQYDQINSLKSAINDRGLRKTDRILYFGSLNHIGGFATARLNLVVGATLDLLDLNKETPQSVQDWIVSEGVTVLATIPSVFRTLFHDPPSTALFGMRLIQLGTEPLLEYDFQLFKRAFAPGTLLINGYGSTEAGGLTQFIGDHSSVIQGARVPVGIPRTGVEILIVDEDLKSVPVGEVGEITAYSRHGTERNRRQAAPAEGTYFSDPNDPSKYFSRTGDLGYFQADGNLVHLGRRDSMVKIRGFRVELEVVENALNQHPEVEQVTVQAISEENVSRLVAYIVPRQGTSPSIPQLRSFLSKHLADFMIPAQFVFLEAIPQLPNGKINIKALPQPISRVEVATPATATEEKLLPIFQNVLALQKLGREDHFFDFGGDSLKAMRLIADINAHFRIELSPSVIYRHPSIAQLGTHIDQGRPALSSLVALNPYGTQPLMFCVPGQNGNVMNLRQLVAELGHDYPLYGFQHPAYEQKEARFDTLQELANHYVMLLSNRIKGNDYVLVGYSAGGAIIFEMAQQLSAVGKNPLSVIMLDAHFPSDRQGPTAHETFVEQQRLEQLRRDPLLLRIRKTLYRSKQILKRRIADLTDAKTRTIKHVKAETGRNVNSYQPQPFAGKIFYLSCRQDRLVKGEPDSHPEQSWEKMASGGFELIDTAGDHTHMLDMPHVRVTARHIRRIIAAQDRKT